MVYPSFLPGAYIFVEKTLVGTRLSSRQYSSGELSITVPVVALPALNLLRPITGDSTIGRSKFSPSSDAMNPQ